MRRGRSGSGLLALGLGLGAALGLGRLHLLHRLHLLDDVVQQLLILQHHSTIIAIAGAAGAPEAVLAQAPGRWLGRGRGLRCGCVGRSGQGVCAW